MDVVPVSAAVNLYGPYWQVGGLAGFRITEKVEPLTVPRMFPLRSYPAFENVVAQVPDNESLAAWIIESDNVPLPRSASKTGPDQLPDTFVTTGAVADFPPHETTATIPAITSNRFISAKG